MRRRLREVVPSRVTIWYGCRSRVNKIPADPGRDSRPGTATRRVEVQDARRSATARVRRQQQGARDERGGTGGAGSVAAGSVGGDGAERSDASNEAFARFW